MTNAEVNTFENSQKAKNIAEFRLPRYDELTNFDVFMTQLVDILDNYLSIFQVPGEQKLITPSMINNYVFKQVVKPPVQKKYTKNHIVYFLVTGILKQVLSISDIAELIVAQKKQYPIEQAYNYFCDELEKALKVTFEVRDFSQIELTQPTKPTPLAKEIRSAVISFANKIYVQQSIYFELHKE